MLALAVTLAVALQAFFASLALGNTEQLPQRDAFGRVLCLGTDGGAGEDAPLHGRSILPDCCTFACSMFWPQTPPPGAVAIGPAPVVPRSTTVPSPVPAIVSSFLDHRSSQPRAPPAIG